MFLFGDLIVEKCGNADIYFLVDKNMQDELQNHKWTLEKNGYLCRNQNGKIIRLHTVVIEKNLGHKIPKGMYVDHINKCKTDNRLCNLRIVSPKDSAKNMPIKSNNTTGTTGVSKGRGGKGYRAYITINKKQINLGTYKTKEEASRARYIAEEKYGFTHQQNLSAFLCEMLKEEYR